ncbi:hypothetical protein A9Q99_10070 [Gammaproteobacteria bacterium 45_16_T64]|nr:hypothetical protein A9Q99_10070 [Gammaproteobacteria bacterium 45_16_T64]
MVLSKRKTIAIIVKPDQSVEVRAPRRVSKREVESFLQLKQAWVLSKLNEFSLRPAPHQPIFELGASHYFLGEPHRLVDATKAIQGQQMGLALSYEDDVIPLRSIDGATSAQVERKLDQWYRVEALALFQERHDYWREQMEEFLLPESVVTLRKMKRRWGSCSIHGKITFSTALAKYPLQCIDSVVVHELCHLLEFSHNQRFYGFMDQVYPDWKLGDKLLQSLSWQY